MGVRRQLLKQKQKPGQLGPVGPRMQRQHWWQLSNRCHRPELSTQRLGWRIAGSLDPPVEQLVLIIRRWADALTKPPSANLMAAYPYSQR